MPFIKWSEAMFGKGITKHFMKPYNEKLWSYDLNKMTAEWTGPFVPKPDAKSIVKSAYSENKKQYGYNSVFYYPKRGGCQALIDGLLKKVKPELNSKTEKINIKNKTVTLQNGKKAKYDNIISTQPLNELIKQISGVPESVKKAANRLLRSSVRCVNIGVCSKKGIPAKLKNRHWVYIPEKKFPFYRIGVYSNVSKAAAPKNCYSFYVEFSSINGKYKNSENVVKELKKAGFIGKDDEITALNVVDMPDAYVIFDKNRNKTLRIINEFLNKHNIYSIGRYGAWEYSFIEKNIKDAIQKDTDFHEVIYRAARNDHLVQITGNLRDHIQRYRVVYFQEMGAMVHLVKEHEKILAALEAKDVRRGREAAQKHINKQEKDIVRVLS